VFVDLENCADIRMTKSRGGLSLPFETAPSRAVGHTVADELYRDLTAKVLVLGNIYLAHSPGTEMTQDAVV
jgi:hypothetical protein